MTETATPAGARRRGAVEAAPPRARREPRRVLVVDDDVDIREPLVELFENEGYGVASASDGRQALAEARRFRPDVILLDLRMPVMNGLEFRAEQARDPSLAGIPVIVISAEAHDMGATLHLPKPFHLEEVLGAVRRFAA